jgi:hypothetical protein
LNWGTYNVFLAPLFLFLFLSFPPLQTGVIPPTDVDVILVAPKGSGRTVRTLFLEGRGINSSVAVFQDVTGKAMEKAVALGIAVGSGYCYETTFEKEVRSEWVKRFIFLSLKNELRCLGVRGMEALMVQHQQFPSSVQSL